MLHILSVAGKGVELSTNIHVRVGFSFAEQAHTIQQFLRLKVVYEYLRMTNGSVVFFILHSSFFIFYIHHIERMQAVLMVDVHSVIAVLQYIDHTGRTIVCCRYNSMKTKRSMLNVCMFFEISQQVHTKLIKSQVHNTDACVHLFYINHFAL